MGQKILGDYKLKFSNSEFLFRLSHKEKNMSWEEIENGKKQEEEREKQKETERSRKKQEETERNEK